jgi:hypothetical protein
MKAAIGCETQPDEKHTHIFQPPWAIIFAWVGLHKIFSKHQLNSLRNEVLWFRNYYLH